MNYDILYTNFYNAALRAIDAYKNLSWFAQHIENARQHMHNMRSSSSWAGYETFNLKTGVQAPVAAPC